MTAYEATIYASERSLAIRGLGILAVLGVCAGLIFAMLYGTVNPRLRRMVRRSKRLADQIVGLKLEHANLTLQNESLTRQVQAAEKGLFEAQHALAAAELEVRRNTMIRKKTEDALIKYKREVDGR